MFGFAPRVKRIGRFDSSTLVGEDDYENVLFYHDRNKRRSSREYHGTWWQVGYRIQRREAVAAIVDRALTARGY